MSYLEVVVAQPMVLSFFRQKLVTIGLQQNIILQTLTVVTLKQMKMVLIDLIIIIT